MDVLRLLVANKKNIAMSFYHQTKELRAAERERETERKRGKRILRPP